MARARANKGLAKIGKRGKERRKKEKGRGKKEESEKVTNREVGNQFFFYVCSAFIIHITSSLSMVDPKRILVKVAHRWAARCTRMRMGVTETEKLVSGTNKHKRVSNHTRCGFGPLSGVQQREPERRRNTFENMSTKVVRLFCLIFSSLKCTALMKTTSNQSPTHPHPHMGHELEEFSLRTDRDLKIMSQKIK